MRAFVAILFVAALAAAASDICVPVDPISSFCSGLGLMIYPNLSSSQPDCGAVAYYDAASALVGPSDPLLLANIRMIACALFYPPCFYENTSNAATSYSVWLQVCASSCYAIQNHTGASLPPACSNTTYWVDDSVGNPCCSTPQVTTYPNGSFWYHTNGARGIYPSVCAPPSSGWSPLPPMPTAIQVDCGLRPTSLTTAASTTLAATTTMTGYAAKLCVPVLALWAIFAFLALV